MEILGSADIVAIPLKLKSRYKGCVGVVDKEIEAEKVAEVVVAVEGNALKAEDEVPEPVVGDDAPTT
nr:hypothetical protein CFP56_29832 [Quercus suber]